MKKIYNRESKKWETPEAVDLKIKKRSLCKGGRQHDWVRVLPWGAEALDNYQGDVEIYYRAQEEIKDFVLLKNKELLAVGIKNRASFYTGNDESRHETCSVCKKNRYVKA